MVTMKKHAMLQNYPNFALPFLILTKQLLGLKIDTTLNFHDYYGMLSKSNTED